MNTFLLFMGFAPTGSCPSKRCYSTHMRFPDVVTSSLDVSMALEASLKQWAWCENEGFPRVFDVCPAKRSRFVVGILPLRLLALFEKVLLPTKS